MAGESKFKTEFRTDLDIVLPGIFILPGNASVIQGIPDWLLLFNDRWAMLEFKARQSAARQPNQEYYVDIFNKMSFAAFVYPENKEVILHELQIFFTSRTRRPSRVSQR